MRLKSRLAKLETHAAGSGPTRQESSLIVSILARRDALFWPWRWQSSKSIPFPEIRRRQREYLAGQIGIAAKADGRDAWKDAHAARQNLIASGHIDATHASGQVQSVFLTPLGEAYARALVGSRLITFEQSKPLLIWLRDLHARSPAMPIRESVLFCRDLGSDPSEWDDLTELALPMLACGVIQADTDMSGRVAYSPTLAAEPTETQLDGLPATDPEMDDLYVRSYQSERHTLECADSRDSHEIYIPLPATGWGWTSPPPESDENP